MARSGRPASESYQSACCSVGQSLSSSSEVGILEDEDDRTPIFSLSKSSVDVVTATGPPHKRDLAWMRLDLKRSSSTNTHSDQNQVTLQQLHHHKWHHNSHQFSVTTQNEDLHSPPPLSERWISNMHRWSGCSSSTHSRSSTPDTVVGKEGSSRSCCLSQEAPGCFTPDSPMSRVTSPPTTPSPLISPFHTPTLPPQDHLASSPLTPSTHRESEYSPRPRITRRDDSNSPEKLLFQFPSPVQSHGSLTDEGQCADSACLVNDESKESPSPIGTQVMEDKGEESPLPADCKPEPSPSAEKTDFKAKLSGCHYLLSLEQSCQTGKSWRTPLVTSLSDSRLGDLMMQLEATANNLKSEPLREEGTMTSQLEMMDAAVQTGSPLGSCCDFQKNMSNSNSGSHSLLGSPPGSRLNLKAAVGSHSNLVSASSSMFPVSSGEEEEEKQQNTPEWDGTAASARYLERKRSCLKAQSEDCDELGRRGSMKQVLWDEDGLTWDIHGASLDPEELSTAIQKHLDLKNSPQPQRRSSKKKKAPMPPLISNMVTTMAPDTSPPAMSIKCMVEGESEETLETEAASEVQLETGGRKQEKEEANCSRSREEQGKIQEIEEEEGGEKTANSVKSLTQGSGHSKKKIVIRSLRRPGWCGGSKKTDE
ncbi:PREDICTED: uncharacterized protein LOC106928958 [Poecilia mexicana]|uniref:uncharacterized protein LOC106928958 n=1 Tax=Poecilia mexicana TaxID=48701 RepID=UPI00072DB445|nr:PREDICTED: uncharacterized protein LOC106928958 [Poecilia mexicana]